MKVRRNIPGILLLLILVAGCAQLDGPGTPAPSPSPPPTAAPTATEPQPTLQPESITLVLWVPPRFDPQGGTSAGARLEQRLAEFTELNPRIRVTVRVKASEGPASLLASLTAAHAAAPLALPDLIALTGTDLETAAIKGLVFPIDELTDALDSEDWYPYARSMVHVEEQNFGLPFAGDALVLIYRPSRVGDPPADFQEALALEDPLAFPAASPSALFPLTLYRAAGGLMEDADGRPTLETPALNEVLTFFAESTRTGLLPFWLTQFDTDELAQEAYRDNRAHLAISWATTFLQDPAIDTVAAPLPTPDGMPFTLTRGWSWALSSPDPERRQATIQLIEFLTVPEFLGPWTLAADVLPPRQQALEQWPASRLHEEVEEISASGEPVPPAGLLNVIGPALQEATIQVLKELSLPQEAARNAIESLGAP